MPRFKSHPEYIGFAMEGCLCFYPWIFDHSGTQLPYFRENNNITIREARGWDMQKYTLKSRSRPKS